MIITRVSPMTKIENSLDINVTQEQLDKYFIEGAFIQKAFPNLTPSEREFIKTGFTAEDWDALFPDEEDEDWDNEP